MFFLWGPSRKLAFLYILPGLTSLWSVFGLIVFVLSCFPAFPWWILIKNKKNIASERSGSPFSQCHYGFLLKAMRKCSRELRILLLSFVSWFLIKNKKAAPESSASSSHVHYDFLLKFVGQSLPRTTDPSFPLFIAISYQKQKEHRSRELRILPRLPGLSPSWIRILMDFKVLGSGEAFCLHRLRPYDFW